MLAVARRMGSSPIVTVNLWFDRPLFEEPFLGLPGRAMQWVFDKRSALRRSGLAPVARRERRLAPRRSREPGAHRRGPPASSSMRCPRPATARLRRATVIREPRATFSLAPGQPSRPGTATPIRGLWLAGDWIATGLPATIESAVTSGHWAADLAVMNAIVVHYKELALKGRNRSWFVQVLVRKSENRPSRPRRRERPVGAGAHRNRPRAGRLVARGAHAGRPRLRHRQFFDGWPRAARFRRAGGGDHRRSRRSASGIVPRRASADPTSAFR